MALNKERIDINKVNNKNFNNVRTWAQQRLNVVKDLESQVGGLTQHLTTTKDIPEFGELEKVVHSLCSNVKQYLKRNSTAADQFKVDLKTSTTNYEDARKEVEDTNKDVSVLVNDREEGKRMFKECLLGVDKYVDQINTITLSQQNPSSYAKIHFDKLWVWVLDFLYDIGSNKYDWKNFSKQCFIIDGGNDFKNRMKKLDYKKFTPYQIEAAKRTLALKGILSQEINSSDINSLMAAIEEMVKAAEYRVQYKTANTQITDNVKTLAAAKIKIDVHKEIFGINRESFDIATEVTDKVSMLHHQLAINFAEAIPNTEYKSEVIQQEVESASIDKISKEQPKSEIPDDKEEKKINERSLDESAQKPQKKQKEDNRDQEETDAKPRKMKLDQLKETIPENEGRKGACGDGDCCLI